MYEQKKKGTRRTICAITLIPILTLVIFLVVWRPLFLPYFFRYSRLIISEAMNFEQRREENKMELADKEWRMYQIESRFGQDWCKENVKSRSDVTWLTIVVDENFASAALVLGHSIRTFSCQKNMIALISETVSEATRKALQSVGWNTRLVEEMDCNWLDAKLGGDRNSGWLGKPLGYRIKGTHTRFHAWNYTEFSKIIYVDADYILMTNIDRLFDIPDDFAAAPCARPGIVDPCFNAGLLVFRPDTKYYQEIMDLWRETTKIDTCPDADAGNWKVLPFSFNIRLIIYRPLNSFHFAGGPRYHPPKPWSAKCRPSRKEARDYDRPILVADDMIYIFWKNLYELLERYNLEDWWRSTKLFRPAQEFGAVPYADCNDHIEDD
ncbi:glycogenin-1-like [Oculina patagonica]